MLHDAITIYIVRSGPAIGMDTVGHNSVACSIVSSINSRGSSDNRFATAVTTAVVKSKPSAREKTVCYIATVAAAAVRIAIASGVGQLAQHLPNLFVHVTEEVYVTHGTVSSATVLY